MMATLFLSMVLFMAVECKLRYRPIFRAEDHNIGWDEFKPVIKQVPCNNKAERLYQKAVEEVRCGEPKEVYVEIHPPSYIEKVHPTAAWVKRCVGICDFDSSVPTQCVPTHGTKSIHTRMFNIKTEKAKCVAYDMEEHTGCSCPDPSYDYDENYVEERSSLFNLTEPEDELDEYFDYLYGNEIAEADV